MKLCVFGLGYIGLPTALLFAAKGVNVIGVDIDRTLIKEINDDEILIKEAGLQEIFINARAARHFRASLIAEKADVFMIAVPTPAKDDEWQSCDLTKLLDVVDKIIPLLDKGNTVIIESTIPPNTIETYIAPTIKAAGWNIGKEIFLAYCPERVIPGNIVHEFTYNNRIVGGVTNECSRKVVHFYKKVVKGEILTTDVRTAEMVKLMENVYRDVNISLANESFKICHELGIDVLEVMKLANEHPRVNYLQPSAGVGGHCLAIDPNFVISQAPQTAKMLRLAREINNSMPLFVVEAIRKIMKDPIGRKIAILGVSYKGNITDVRESPGIKVYERLKELGDYELAVYDPHVELNFVKNNLNEVMTDASLAVILADHDEFKSFSSDNLLQMRHRVFFDAKDMMGNFEEKIDYIHFGNLHEFIG